MIWIRIFSISSEIKVAEAITKKIKSCALNLQFKKTVRKEILNFYWFKNYPLNTTMAP